MKNKILAFILTICTFDTFASVPKDVENALVLAINDEYHAEAVYSAVIEKFGSIRPFENIVKAEKRHAKYLVDIMHKYGLVPPHNTYINSKEVKEIVPNTIKEACLLGIDAEIKNVKLYDDNLIPKVKNYPDILEVMTLLRNASEKQHLPAFQKCGSLIGI